MSSPLLDLDYESRFRLAEVPMMAIRFPEFVPVRFNNGSYGFQGNLRSRSGATYRIAIVLPQTTRVGASYPSVPAVVYVVEPRDLEPRVHVYNDGSLCLIHPLEWNPNFTVPTIIAMAAEWFANFEMFKSTGTWPGPEIH